MQGHQRIGERLAGLFVLGLFAFAPPLLSIFDVPSRVFGIPALYVYLFTVWLALVALVALVVERSRAADWADRDGPAQSGD